MPSSNLRKTSRTELQQLKADCELALLTLKPFIGHRQLSAVRHGMKGREKEFFLRKMIELAQIIDTMPVTYGQDGKGDNTIVYLHYFAGGTANWWITEKDKGDVEEPGQIQAYGLVSLYTHDIEDASRGYVSIEELLANNVELDFYFEPRPVWKLKGLPDPNSPTPESGSDKIIPFRPLDTAAILSELANL